MIYSIKRIFFIARHTARSSGGMVLTSLVGGGVCAVCGGRCRYLPICRVCRTARFMVAPLDERRCGICGKQLISERVFCLECRKEPALKHTDGVFPLFSYRLWNSVLLSRWKFQADRTLSAFFAECLAARLRQMREKFGELCLVPVPPRAGKIREHGWDQIEELCGFLEFKYGFRMRRMLERCSKTEQKSLNRRGRLETIGKSYRVKDGGGPVPEQVCIIDDVMTTGATIESCAAALKSIGVKKAYATALFSVD